MDKFYGDDIININDLVLANNIQQFIKVIKTNKKEARARSYFESINDFLYENTKQHEFPTHEIIPIKLDLKKEIIKILEKKNYDEEIKKAFKIILDTTDNNHLIICLLNLNNLTFDKIQRSIIPFFHKIPKSVNGIYSHQDHKISYYNYEALGHEILHMASSREFNGILVSGFERIGKKTIFFKGLNEGYTQMLTRRKFFNDNYNTNCYNINVHLVLLLELLFDDKNNFESAYFYNDTNFIYNTFCQYGSKKEFFRLTKFLDFFSETSIHASEDIEMLKLMKAIILRTADAVKISKSYDIIDDYLETQKPKFKKKRIKKDL